MMNLLGRKTRFLFLILHIENERRILYYTIVIIRYLYNGNTLFTKDIIICSAIIILLPTFVYSRT